MPTWLIWTMGILVGVFVLIAVVVSIAVLVGARQKKQILARLMRHTELAVGMPESEMRARIGDGFAYSLLSGGAGMYEWEADKARKLTVYVRGGKVERILPQNLE